MPGFKQVVVAGILVWVLCQDQINNFFLVFHRVIPAAHARFTKRFDASRMKFQLLFGRKQVIAVEVDAHRARGIDMIGKTSAFKEIWLIGYVSSHGIHLAINQVLRIEARLHTRDPIGCKTLLLEISEQLITLRVKHHTLVKQVVNPLRLHPLRSNQYLRRMLKHGRQNNHWRACIACEQ